MESGPPVDGTVDGSRENRRWVENKVYTRKHNRSKPNLNQKHLPLTQTHSLSSQQTLTAGSYGIDYSLYQPQLLSQPPENLQPAVAYQSFAASNEEASKLHSNLVSTSIPSNGQNRIVTINLALKAKHEVRELRRKLASDLEMVLSVAEKLDALQMKLSMNQAIKTASLSGNNTSQLSANDVGISFPIKKAPPISETASAAAPSPVYSQLTVSVRPTAGGGEGIVDVFEKVKRTPKVNQYYKKTDSLLGTGNSPESNKKPKVNGIKFEIQSAEGKINEMIFKKCSVLLSKLMKHNNGWVFNAPVDVEALGLPDYHIIITHPMDLGTIRSRLSKNWYKAPKEFAEDVRLTFHNAMAYNSKGHAVHMMAQQLLQIFEEHWPVLEADLAYHQSPLLMKKLLPHDPKRTLERSDSTISHLAIIDLKAKSLNQLTHDGRPSVSKKPKARDKNKREMTFEEKQKLSNDLQNLPSEKLDLVVLIIRERNLTLSQHDDEIEVDIDSVDTETLWELVRFVTHYKKSLSKGKRKAELATFPKAECKHHAQLREQSMVTDASPSPQELLKENKTVGTVEKVDAPSLVGGTTVGENESRLSSLKSSSSHSGSSLSDSENRSSSGYGSESPRT